MRASYFRFARCKYVPTILSESLAQAGVAGTLRATNKTRVAKFPFPALLVRPGNWKAQYVY